MILLQRFPAKKNLRNGSVIGRWNWSKCRIRNGKICTSRSAA